MWALIGAALVAAMRKPLGLSGRFWRVGHTALATGVVACTVAHAMLIEGLMGIGSKAALCVLALAATEKVMLDFKPWKLLFR